MTSGGGPARTGDGCNPVEHVGKALDHVVVGDADDMQATTSEDLIAGSIMSLLLGMYSAVNFNDNARSIAVEIGDEAVDHLLPPKAQSRQTTATKRSPQLLFGWRHVPPKFAR